MHVYTIDKSYTYQENFRSHCLTILYYGVTCGNCFHLLNLDILKKFMGELLLLSYIHDASKKASKKGQGGRLYT